MYCRPIKEVSLVESAAFPSAAVMKIAANENAVDENQPKETKGETVDKAPDEVAAEGTYLPDGATVTLKSVSYKDDEAEGATQPVEAARRIIKPSALNFLRMIFISANIDTRSSLSAVTSENTPLVSVMVCFLNQLNIA